MSNSSTGLTNEDLVSRIRNGEDVNDNLQKLYDRNRGTIYKFIRPYLLYSEEADLMQEAFFGLWNAVQYYDPDTGNKFITYAGYWIKQQVARYCKSCCQLKRIPDFYVQRIRSYKKYIRSYFNEYQAYPSNEQISEALSISEKKLIELQRIIVESSYMSLEECVPGTEDLCVKDTIPDTMDIEEQVSQEIDRAALWKIVDSLESPMCTVIDGYYHLNIPQRELAEICGVSQQRIGQIKRDAFQVLRKKKKVQELAIQNGYRTSNMYHGSLASFNNSGTSVVESMVIRKMTMEEEKQKLISELANIKMSHRKDGTNENNGKS